MTEITHTLHRGSGPLLLSLPHIGTWLPSDVRERLLPAALEVPDTDWHLDTLYGFARELGASILMPRASRYLIDLNRPPEDAPMYPGANNTGLCPVRAFTGEPIYRPGQEPDPTEIEIRRDTWWRPYHHALEAELTRLRATHGHALLWDGHSIKAQLPWLFEGRLPDLNLGMAAGTSCDPTLGARLAAVLEGQRDYSFAIDGRFKGGYITRRYGRPAEGIHAAQMEMGWHCYMHETPPYAYAPERARAVQPLLRSLLETMLEWRPA